MCITRRGRSPFWYFKILSAVCTIWLHVLFAQSQNDVYFSKIGIEEGLSQLSVMTIYQDELGSMWFGTREGLNIYDGNRITILQPTGKPENSLSGNLIKEIYGDARGSVFIHTQNGIDQYNLKTGTITPIITIQVNTMSYGHSRLWYAKDNRIFNVSNGQSIFFDEIDSTAQITTILPASGNRLYVGTISSGVFVIDQNKKIEKLLPECSRVASLFEDSKKDLWVSTWENGIYMITPDNAIINYRQNREKPAAGLSSDFARVVCEDGNGDIWIGTKEGLDKLDRASSRFYHYDSEVNNDKSLSNKSVWSLYKDNRGNLWVGTYFGGANYFNPKSDSYTLHDLANGSFANKPFPIISEIIPYNDSTTFLCTEGDGLILYNTRNKTYAQITGLENDNIKTAWLDRDHNLLFLGLHLGGLATLELKSMLLSRYNPIREGLDQSNIVRRILPYNDQYIIATYNGLYLFDKENETFSVFSELLHQHVTYFVDVAIDKQNNLWVASRGLFKYNMLTGEVRQYFHDPNDDRSLSNINVTKLYLDSADRIWIATSGGGVNLYNADTDSFRRFTSLNTNLKNDYISNMTESPLGYIYLTTTRGLSYINPENGEVTSFASNDGITLNSLFNGGITVMPGGQIYVAGMNGMVSFDEREILEVLEPVNIYFSNLWVNNREVIPNDPTGLLKEKLTFTRRLKFNHRQSILKFEFSSDHITALDRYRYQYRIRGLSNEWISLREGVHEINLMNLDAGNYILELAALPLNSKDTAGTTAIAFYVTPPFYRSTWAYILYLLAGLALILFYVRYLKYKIRLESSLEYEKKEKAHIEEVNQSKLRFFTNISHEFRTPLTLIASQVDMLLQQKKLQPGVLNRILSISRNSALLTSLINELLDFRKINDEKMPIKAGEYNIVQFIHEIYLSFEEYAEAQKIDFSFHAPDDNAILLWFDQNQMQKVFFNLISNAFKYTAKGGKIAISISQEDEKVYVSVKDSGIGISPENKSKIFEQFYQIGTIPESIGAAIPGTGLGLALTKGILDAHHAEIRLESEVNKGSNFEVVLLKGSAHFSETEKIVPESRDNISIQKIKDYLPGIRHDMETDLRNNVKGNQERKNSILIVEDNEELLQVLYHVFEPVYHVFTATNGEEGLTKTIEKQPDIVLSDLMMPHMSGSEMCLKIKTNFMVCHIPVVLLTAQTAVESNIESLKLGADDYITKPFDVAVLLARCNNLVNGRKILQEKFAHSTDTSPYTLASNEMDRSFLEKANKIIEENMANPEFGINEFSQGMNLGRTSLFNKIKGITGQTPNDFMITLKMKKANFLLINHPELNISDITYRLGFNSPKYFSKCFKDQFGMTPSDYKALHRSN